MSGWRDRVLPARPIPASLSGILMALAFPPFHMAIPSFVALVPLIVWLEDLPAGSDGARQARAGGFFFGLIYFTLVFYWLLVALIFYTWLAVLAFLVPILVMAWFASLTLWGVHTVRTRLRWPVWFVLPVFWVAQEWLRSHLPDVAFPWMQLGDSLTGHPQLIGAADLVGSRGLSLWLAAVNALIAIGLLGVRERGFRGGLEPAIALALVIGAPVGYSLARWDDIELRPAARVGVIQPNVPEHIKLDDPWVAADTAIRAATNLAAPWEGMEELDLVVMPETMAPVYLEPIPSLEYPGGGQIDEWATDLGRRLEADVLMGALGARDLGEGRHEPFNSAFHYRPGFERPSRYDKRFLVPMVERVPFLPPEWFAGMAFMGRFGVGRFVEPSQVESALGRPSFGIMICYESIFSPLARHYRRSGADFLVNITNDSWFGRDAWWSRSSALFQHPAHLVMRAIETRMGVARSGNTGVSEIVDPLGRVSQATNLFEPAAFVADVMTTDEETLYVRYGDVAGLGSVIAAVLALGASLLGTTATRKPRV
ncbi:MAG: apolipoprotein N-acyltransferase [Gemmatimonadetes bacterium]|nr:apolipoprotein N-acyltransferase [Gemmatimonadota bacterium]